MRYWRWTEFQLPNSPGRPRHGEPVRMIQKLRTLSYNLQNVGLWGATSVHCFAVSDVCFWAVAKPPSLAEMWRAAAEVRLRLNGRFPAFCSQKRSVRKTPGWTEQQGVLEGSGHPRCDG